MGEGDGTEGRDAAVHEGPAGGDGEAMACPAAAAASAAAAAAAAALVGLSAHLAGP